MGRMGTPMGILSLHESSDLRQGSILTSCIASIMRSIIIDQHCIHFESFADLINPVGSGHLSFLYSHKKALRCRNAEVFCISRSSRGVAQTLCSTAEVGMMLGHVLTNQTEIFYLS